MRQKQAGAELHQSGCFRLMKQLNDWLPANTVFLDQNECLSKKYWPGWFSVHAAVELMWAL